MDPCNPEIQRARIPAQGPGPRGMPECYYMPSVSKSTARYNRFIKKLRALEEETRRGEENVEIARKDKRNVDFFLRSESRVFMKKVAYRVDLCFEAYENDLNKKRQRLKNILNAEEEADVRKFLKELHDARERVFENKKARLAYLLAKRKKEHEERYKRTPLAACSHVQPCLVKLRAKEAQEIQLYQMREKQMRKLAEAEIENMWHQLALKESEALAARMEYDEMEKVRRQRECNNMAEYQLRLKREERERQREKLKEEALLLKAQIEEAERKEAEEKRMQQERCAEVIKLKNEAYEEFKEAQAKRQAEEEMIEEAWASLTNQSLADCKAAEERRIQIQKDQALCNQKMAAMRNHLEQLKDSNTREILLEGQKMRDVVDLKRCQVLKQQQKNTVETAKANYQTALEKKEQRIIERNDSEVRTYETQIQNQLDELVKLKQMTDTQAQKLHQKDLREQIEYNNLLKERARQEELDQMKKAEIAKREYEEQVKEMMCRANHSDHVHPFRSAMGSIITNCKCSAPNRTVRY